VKEYIPWDGSIVEWDDQVPRKVIRPTDRVPDGLQRIDGSTCLSLPTMEQDARYVIQGPLYDHAAIDRERVYETTRIGRHPIDSREQWQPFEKVNEGFVQYDPSDGFSVWRPM